jgi:hypothetical protein
MFGRSSALVLYALSLGVLPSLTAACKKEEAPTPTPAAAEEEEEQPK